MDGVDEAFQVLRESGKPLHYRDIAIRALHRKLWSTSGKTPEQTINSYINKEIVHRGPHARFIRLGDGIYAAVSDSAADAKAIPRKTWLSSATPGATCRSLTNTRLCT